jgi:hypothetical protein
MTPIAKETVMQPSLSLLLILALAYAGPALASDGALEISQPCAVSTGCFTGDTPGFPVDVTEPGSYVLTSDLNHDPTVHGNTEIVRILADDITLDLNGFTIRSTSTCDDTSCPGGTVDGIDSGNGDRVTIRNGRVVGVDANCIRLQTEAHVDDVIVSHCAFLGISVGANSLVENCRVTSTGRTGLHTFAFVSPPDPPPPVGTLYRNCTLARNGLRGETTFPDMDASVARGGRAAGTNSCEDDLCGDGRPRFYLTTTPVLGDEPLTACDGGFHMASIWEIRDTSNLLYDRQRGETDDDAGSGPPGSIPLDVDKLGWIRTGTLSTLGSPGVTGNCNAWTQSSGSGGTTVSLRTNWDATIDWQTSTDVCSNARRVWCVED